MLHRYFRIVDMQCRVCDVAVASTNRGIRSTEREIVATSGIPILPADWFVRCRDSEPLASILGNVQRDHCLSIIKDAIQRNKQQNRSPSSLERLADAVNRDRNNVRRRSRIAPTELLVMAAVLGIDVRELIPGNVEWLENVVLTLCGDSVVPTCARTFAKYCLISICNNNLQPTIDYGAVQTVAQEFGTAPTVVEESVYKTMASIYEKLPPQPLEAL